MKSYHRFLFAVAATLSLVASSSLADDLSWPALTSQNKPWAWWWWPGSAVSQADIASQMQTFDEAGLGGVQIIPIYGIKGGQADYINFLSPQWMQMMGYTVSQGQGLGMGVDMALETGWCFGGPTITKEEANAFVVENTFDVSGGSTFSQTFSDAPVQSLMAFNKNGGSVNLTDKIGSDGKINWTAPEGQWKVYAISQKFSGQMVKRAAPGGRGPMLNPFYPKAMGDYLKWYDKAFDAYTGPKPGAVFQDSYEYQGNWSPDLFQQFKKLRGYDLQTELPALFGDAPDDEVARVKSDYRETISDLMAVKTDPMWMNWARQHGFLADYQAHGAPANWLDLYGDADIPNTEMFHTDRNPLVSKFASSAAHVAGHPYTGAETGTWVTEHFHETFTDLKYLADDMFISGVNHIFYHGCCYSPASAPWPGWLFYASTEMNPRNSIWHDVGAFNAYVARCQSILQSGKPDNDVLLYWPISDLWNTPDGMLPTMTVSKTEWFENQPIGHTAEELWKRGYSFDYISDRQLINVKMDGKQSLVPGNSYVVVVVPPCQRMPVESLEKLIGLAKLGGTVIFESSLPADVPGWGQLEKRRAQFKKLLAEIKPDSSGSNLQEAKIGHGQILIGDADAALAQTWAAREPMNDHTGLFYIRRSSDDGYNYFIANRQGEALDGWVTLGCPGQSAALFDPLSGNTGVAKIRALDGKAQVYLQLPPGGSIILRLYNHDITGPAWNYWETNGPTTEIAGQWNVNFVQGGPVLPASFQTTRLASWTEDGDTNAQSFAGSALYTINFDASATEGSHYFLNLGSVCQSARVHLNGKDYGTLLAPPFGVVVDNLKPSGNKLEVEVTNASANRIRDLDRRHVAWKYFGDIGIVDVNYQRLDASDWPLVDSGLLGPVTFTPVAPPSDLTAN